ncbi:MAG: LLM class flavin-dependent oxidoreductase [Alphaproteobacteria bacterium]|nr:LLM class flavin-dependent oxidoreductase [Alphaproteobacteria bacterium]
MRLGALLGPVTDGAACDTLAAQARRYAAEGFAGLWSGHAVGRGMMVTDPFLTLAVAASVTDGIEIGSAVIQVPLYHPAELAHRVLSLQQICGDRLTLGVGAGSSEKDYQAFGRDFGRRFNGLEESVAALRDAYASVGTLNGTLTPWPGLPSAPRLYLGSWGKGVERAARDYDGWIASGHYRSVEEVADAARRYREAGGGRAIVSTLILDARTDLTELGERFSRFAEAGFDDAVVMFHPGSPEPAAVRRLVD